MKRYPYIILSVALLALSSASADTVRTEQFVGYSSGTLGNDSARGTLNGWNLSTAEISLTNGSGSLIGTNLGLVASEGDRAFISGVGTNSTGGLIGARNQFAAAGTFPQTVDTNIYFSFLYKFRNAADISADGEYVAQVNRGNSGIATPQHWNLLAKNVGGQIQLGIAKAGAPNNATNYASVNINVGDTVFIVVRQHIIPGTQNDVYDVWINPPAATFGTNEANIPPVDASIGALTTDGAEDTSTTGAGRFVIFAGPNAEFDEFRVATTWAEATPWFGQCNSPVIAVQPTNVTQSAEISATFRVVATGTSPTYQWQLSTDSGSTWNDVSGATLPTYTTPNLPMSSNGNQYRVVVTTECNGNSVTSSVATVTLIAPTPTPLGVVLHDTFLDPELGFDDRANMPVTVSNSVWFTQITDNLVAFNQGGNMVGTPLESGSSLWLGYFINTNDLPVHLDIGRAIKVTLPFTPNSFNAFTNNAGLRFGIYDYYDGGTRLTIDGTDAGGSRGNGIGVRGYMLNLDFGPTFSANSPLQLLARNFLDDVNLMGSTAHYQSFGSGPAGGGYQGAPAFQAGTQYTLEFTVARIGVNTVTVTASVTGGGTNWTHTITDSNYAYHRFDAFGIRPERIQVTADSFTFPEFLVEVVEAAIPLPDPIPIEVQKSGNNVVLSWTNSAFTLQSAPTVTGTYTNVPGATSPYTNSATDGQKYFRLIAN